MLLVPQGYAYSHAWKIIVFLKRQLGGCDIIPQTCLQTCEGEDLQVVMGVQSHPPH